jgi:aminopeptidase N
MENPGLIYFRELYLFLQKGASGLQKITVTRYIAHEISHLWFGDKVTMVS